MGKLAQYDIESPNINIDVAAVWAASLAQHRHRLESKRLRGLVKELDYDSFQSTLYAHDQRFRDHRLTRCLEAMAPALRGLDKFTRAINTVVQVQSNPLAIIWGSVQAALVVCMSAPVTKKWRTDLHSASVSLRTHWTDSRIY
jgi:hypothetical protein